MQLKSHQRSHWCITWETINMLALGVNININITKKKITNKQKLKISEMISTLYLWKLIDKPPGMRMVPSLWEFTRL